MVLQPEIKNPCDQQGFNEGRQPYGFTFHPLKMKKYIRLIEALAMLLLALEILKAM